MEATVAQAMNDLATIAKSLRDWQALDNDGLRNQEVICPMSEGSLPATAR
jgi:hypothetical protein